MTRLPYRLEKIEPYLHALTKLDGKAFPIERWTRRSVVTKHENITSIRGLMPKSRPMLPAIHFTHHTCRIADPDVAKYDPPTALLETDHNLPLWACAGWGSTPVTDGLRRFSLKIDGATCRPCLELLHKQKQYDALDLKGGVIKRVLGHEELILVAWEWCCRHRGAPDPRLASKEVMR